MDIDYAREYLPFLPYRTTLVVMYLCVAIVVVLFIWGLVRRYRRYGGGGGGLWRMVNGKALPWSPRLRRALRDTAVQTKVRERRLPAVLHLPIFYGMVLLFAGTAIVVVYEDVLHWFGEFRLSGLFYVLFEFTLDLAGLALMVGLLVAMWRRFVQRPDHLVPKAATNLVLIGLLFMGLTGFALEAYRIAAHPNDWAAFAFVGWSLSHLLSGVAAGQSGTVVAGYEVIWWAHAGAAFSLIVGLAWSGLSHVLLVPATVAAHDPRRSRTRLTTPFDLIAAMESDEDVEFTVGTAATSDIAPPDRLAADACVACGRCHQECPATAAGRALSPRDLVQGVQRALGTGIGAVASDRPASDFEEDVWSCTNCYACEQACPARIRHVDIILDFRRSLVDQSRLDEQKASMLQALDRNQNPYRLPSHERAAWLADAPFCKDVTFGATSRSDPPEYLYWIGCSAAYDERAGDVVRTTMNLLVAAGVDFVTLGTEEPCCGEPAKRLGEEGRFQMIAATVIELVRATGARKVVTHCPHCLNSFANEYPSLGFSIPAVHHTELLCDLLARGDLPGGGSGEGAVVYHEPCNLARGGRSSAAALSLLGGDVLLPSRSGERTFCCGGGGANSFYQVKEEKRISSIRYEELVRTNARRIAVSCPFCLTMMRDAASTQGSDALEVVDVAEELQRRLYAPDEEARHATERLG